MAGHRGLAGSAIRRALEKEGYSKLILKSHGELDLEDQGAVLDFFKTTKPEYVFMAAAKVGGIHANSSYRADFILINLKIQTNVLDAALKTCVKRVMFLGSSCIYPKECPQPMKEEHLLTGELEQTNEPYAIAKIAGLKTVEAINRQHGAKWISVMPTNLYGPNDNFHPENSHVLPALIRRFHEAKTSGAQEVVIWGTGEPKREFLHVDDMACACLYLMGLENETGMFNIGTGEEISIGELARLIGDIVGYEGDIKFDNSKPDGTPRKLLDVARLSSKGWNATISLRDGIESTCKWFARHQNDFREK